MTIEGSKGMKNLATYVFYGIFVIFLVFSAILLAGFVQIVFFNWSPPDIFTAYFATVIGESIAMLLLYAKNVAGLRSGISTAETYKTFEAINGYMKKLVQRGGSLDIVSSSLSWISKDDAIKQEIFKRANDGQIDIYIPQDNAISKELAQKGIRVHIIPSLINKQFARFTFS